MTPCTFCKIIGKEMDSDLTVFEDEHVIAQISLLQKPGNHGHVLVIPKQHIKNIYELPAELNAPLMAALQRMACAVKKAFAADGINIRQNNEAAAGQDVFHLHFHVVPRFQDDTFEAGKYERLPLELRRELAEKLKASL